MGTCLHTAELYGTRTLMGSGRVGVNPYLALYEVAISIPTELICCEFIVWLPGCHRGRQNVPLLKSGSKE